MPPRSAASSSSSFFLSSFFESCFSATSFSIVQNIKLAIGVNKIIEVKNFFSISNCKKTINI
jgi:hypothetical protein